jgi:hypothetical protein
MESHKLSPPRPGLVLIILLLGFFGVSRGWAQTVTNSPATSNQPASAVPSSVVLPTFQTEQRTLATALQQLVAQSATPKQIQAWHQQNAVALAAQQERAQYLALVSALEPQSLPATPNIPAGTSQDLKDFLTTQATLAQARVRIHNQLLDSMPEMVTSTQLTQMQQNEEQLFRQQHAADLQLQQQRAQNLANEAAAQPIPIPPALVIPPGTSPQLAALLTAKDHLMRDELTLMNQYTTTTPAVRNAALQAWREQNASRFQQVQAMVQSLPAITSTTQN